MKVCLLYVFFHWVSAGWQGRRDMSTHVYCSCSAELNIFRNFCVAACWYRLWTFLHTGSTWNVQVHYARIRCLLTFQSAFFNASKNSGWQRRRRIDQLWVLFHNPQSCQFSFFINALVHLWNHMHAVQEVQSTVHFHSLRSHFLWQWVSSYYRPLCQTECTAWCSVQISRVWQRHPYLVVWHWWLINDFSAICAAM